MVASERTREASMRISAGISTFCGVVSIFAFVFVLDVPALADSHLQGGNVVQIDIESLEDGLRKTGAIGLGKKILLKRDLDLLVDKIHDYHEGAKKDDIEKLESSFHQLVNKTLSLLRAEDPELHHRISTARSGLWDLLRHRETFQAMVVVEEPTYVAM